uniref:Uncharacterized protein n=1 Tax=Triticum urartu TaxID=4572 RepID=A0A8R7PJ45_TRIUA
KKNLTIRRPLHLLRHGVVCCQIRRRNAHPANAGQLVGLRPFLVDSSCQKAPDHARTAATLSERPPGRHSVDVDGFFPNSGRRPRHLNLLTRPHPHCLEGDVRVVIDWDGQEAAGEAVSTSTMTAVTQLIWLSFICFLG